MPKSYAVAPESANGPTHIMQNGEQLFVSEETICVLLMMGIVYYSPEDGPMARVYRPLGEWTLERIKNDALLLGSHSSTPLQVTARS